MARPANTYRGFRRNEARKNKIIWSAYQRLFPHVWQRPQNKKEKRK